MTTSPPSSSCLKHDNRGLSQHPSLNAGHLLLSVGSSEEQLIHHHAHTFSTLAMQVLHLGEPWTQACKKTSRAEGVATL